MRMWNPAIGRLEDGFLVAWAADIFNLGVLPLFDRGGTVLTDVFCVRKARSTAKDAASISTIERARFRGWVEDLWACYWMLF
jgi:hypothetical protein